MTRRSVLAGTRAVMSPVDQNARVTVSRRLYVLALGDAILWRERRLSLAGCTHGDRCAVHLPDERTLAGYRRSLTFMQKGRS